MARVEVLEKHDLGDRCLMRVRQNVEAPASWREGRLRVWSFLLTARAGAIVMYEFFPDHDRALAAAGLA